MPKNIFEPKKKRTPEVSDKKLTEKKLGDFRIIPKHPFDEHTISELQTTISGIKKTLDTVRSEIKSTESGLQDIIKSEMRKSNFSTSATIENIKSQIKDTNSKISNTNAELKKTYTAIQDITDSETDTNFRILGLEQRILSVSQKDNPDIFGTLAEKLSQVEKSIPLTDEIEKDVTELQSSIKDINETIEKITTSIDFLSRSGVGDKVDKLDKKLVYWIEKGGTGTPSGTVKASTTFNIAADAGTSTEYSKGDHTHGTPATPAGAGDLLADGTTPLTANWDVGAFKITAAQFESDVASGTAPFIIASTTLVTNLNADLFDNESSAYYCSTAAATVLITAHAGSTAAHIGGAGTVLSTAAGTLLIASHAALTAGVHSLGTMAKAASADYALLAATTLVGAGFLIDEDNMVSDSAAKVPSQQSVKAYVDAAALAAGAPVCVAASDATADEKLWATATGGSICDNTSDETEIDPELAGGAHVILSSGTFTIDGNILPTTNSKLIGQGMGSTTIHFDIAQLYITNVDNVEVGGFKITGDVGDPANQATWTHAVEIYANAANMDKFYIHDIWATTISNITDFAVFVNTAHKVSNVLFERCFADSPDGFGFGNNFFNAASVIENLTYRDCRSYNAATAATRYLVGGVCYCNGFDICDGAVAGSTMRNVVLDNCRSDGSWESGFHTEYVPTFENCSMINCIATDAGQAAAAAIYGAGFWMSGVWTITNCHAYLNKKNGFTLSASTGTTLLGGTSHENTENGVEIVDSTDSSAIGVKSYSNTLSGFYVNYASVATARNMILGCHSHDNDGYQIQVGGGANNVDTVIARNVIVSHGWGTHYDSATRTRWEQNIGIVESGNLFTIKKTIGHADITDDGGATGHAHFDDTIPAGSIIKAVKFDYTEAFDSDNTTTLTIQVGYPPAGDADAFNLTASGENAHNTTTDVFWGESDCQESRVTASCLPYILFTEDDDITDVISDANCAGILTITITYMKA